MPLKATARLQACCRFSWFCLLFNVLYCLIIVVLGFRVVVEFCGLSLFVFIRVQSKSAMCISGACFSCSLANFFVFLVYFFFLFAWLYWLLIRWITVCQASVYIYWCYCSLRVPLLSGDFYIAPLIFSVFARVSLFYLYFLNVLKVAVVRESRVLLFTLILSWEPISTGWHIYCPSDSGPVEYVRECVLSIFPAPLAFYCCIMY